MRRVLKDPPPLPPYGHRRWRKRFCWLPEVARDANERRVLVWLEHVTVQEEYYTERFGYPPAWYTLEVRI